jgi:hypothetical protein
LSALHGETYAVGARSGRCRNAPRCLGRDQPLRLRQLAAVLDTVPGPVAIADLVVAESLYVLRGGAGDDAGEPELVNLSSVIATGRLSVLTATEEELETFIDLTLDLDDGEAMTLALAIHRRATVVTDDRKVRRVLAGRAPLRSTLDLVKDWADHADVPVPALRLVLTDLRQRGSYLPSRSHPLRTWWDAILTPP